MIPKPLSRGEEAFWLHCKAYGLEPKREYKFYALRNWKADFCFVAEQIIVEVEGGIWNNGRHTRGAAFEKDCEKYNRAAMLGFRVLRYSTEMIERGDAIKDVLEMILP